MGDIPRNLLPADLGNPNYLFNGDFSVVRKEGAILNGEFNMARLLHSRDGAGATINVTQEEHTPGQTDVPGNPKHFMRVDCTVAGAGETFNSHKQKLKGAATLSGRDVTLAMYLRSPDASIIPTWVLQQNFGTGGSPDVAVETVIASNIDPAATFGLHVFHATLPSITGKSFGTNGDDTLQVILRSPLNAISQIDYSDMMLFDGHIDAGAVHFSRLQHNIMQMLCDQYWQQFGWMELTLAAANSRSMSAFPVPMVAAPTITNSGSETFLAFDSYGFYQNTPDTVASNITLTCDAEL